jgi:hypothetical protein
MREVEPYVVILSPRPGVSLVQVQETLGLADNWYRFADHSWVIITDEPAATWQKRLKRFVDPGGKLFICRLDVTDKQGWLPKPFWTWLRENT